MRFDQIWFRYARRAPWTLSDVDATVQPGETAVVLGRNGAGKSTLLQLALPAAVGLGALASRAVTRSVRNGLTVLVVGAVLAVVLGLSGSFAPWLVPPVMATARALTAAPLPSGGTFWLLTAWALAWCAVVLGGYGWLRRRRS